jgi:hypothetical protein
MALLGSNRRRRRPISHWMAHLRASLLVLVLVAVLLALPGMSGAASMRSCGGGVRAVVVSCAKAKRIAGEYQKTRSRSLQGYTCSSGGGQGRCRLDRKLVTFPLG